MLTFKIAKSDAIQYHFLWVLIKKISFIHCPVAVAVSVLVAISSASMKDKHGDIFWCMINVYVYDFRVKERWTYFRLTTRLNQLAVHRWFNWDGGTCHELCHTGTLRLHHQRPNSKHAISCRVERQSAAHEYCRLRSWLTWVKARPYLKGFTGWKPPKCWNKFRCTKKQNYLVKYVGK